MAFRNGPTHRTPDPDAYNQLERLHRLGLSPARAQAAANPQTRNWESRAFYSGEFSSYSRVGFALEQKKESPGCLTEDSYSRRLAAQRRGMHPDRRPVRTSSPAGERGERAASRERRAERAQEGLRQKGGRQNAAHVAWRSFGAERWQT